MPRRRNPGYASDFALDDADANEDRFDRRGDLSSRSPRSGVRISFHGGLFRIPKTVWGKILAACALVFVAAAGVAATLAVRNFLLHDEHFFVASPSSIQIDGNSHLTRPQLLSVFGGDVERNIFSVPLSGRRAELESLPWVAHATVMRLLPNRIRVAIVERTPVAFVREGKEIGLVDANGVLLDLARPTGESRKTPTYSFPVLTGISAADPLSTRAARMRIYLGFMAALDATGESISRQLSEVDVSNPEDVKAVLPDGGAGSQDLLVHFGDEKFLERYRQYRQHLAEWRAQYPKLASVDMRYERQVVLEMQPGASASAEGAPNDGAGASNSNPKPPAAAKATAAASAVAPGAPAKPARAAARPPAKPSAAVGFEGAPR